MANLEHDNQRPPFQPSQCHRQPRQHYIVHLLHRHRHQPLSRIPHQLWQDDRSWHVTVLGLLHRLRVHECRVQYSRGYVVVPALVQSQRVSFTFAPGCMSLNADDESACSQPPPYNGVMCNGNWNTTQAQYRTVFPSGGLAIFQPYVEIFCTMQSG